MRRTAEAWVALAAVIAMVFSGCAMTSPGGASGLADSASVSSRVNSLLSRMTLAEKVGQMTLVSVSTLRGNCSGTPGPLVPSCLHAMLAEAHVGAVLSGGGEAPVQNTPRAWAQMTNAIQHYAIAHSRLHIPILYGVDAVHGHNNVLGATIFPHNIGMAATWDPALAREVGGATAADVRATGIHWVFAPVSDIARDIRWGRYYETFGEDPYLAASMIAATVKGFQGHDLSTSVAATAKHFVGYSGPQRGLDRANADIPLRTLEETYLPSFEGAIGAGVASVMADSGAVNGVPVHASHYLLTTILRRQLGFRGFVVTDWQDIESLYDRYHLATSESDAIRLAVNAGIDMSMVPYDGAGFARRLTALVRAGKVSRARIDDAVRRILTVKVELGLFQHPYVAALRADGVILGAHRTLARRAADESIVLLKNSGSLLPLHGVHSILVAGEAARDVPEQMGGWTIGWQGVPPADKPPAVTVLQGIEAAARGVAGGVKVSYAATAGKARSAARHADVAVVVVAEKPGAEGLADTETAALPAAQEAVVRAVEGAHVPVTLIVLAGRPLMISDLISHARAALMAWLPGTEGGAATADVLFGTVNPSGRLPVSWPRRIGQVPLYYQQLPTTSADPDAGYHPLYPFGYGLSYSSYASSDLKVVAHGRAGPLDVSVRVTDTGSRAGVDVIQVYGHPEDAPVLVPAKQLIGFARVAVRPGQTRAVHLALSLRPLAVVVGDVPSGGSPRIVAGRYVISAGTAQRTVTIH